MRGLVKRLLPLLKASVTPRALPAAPVYRKLTTGRAAAAAVRRPKPGDVGTPLESVPSHAAEIPFRTSPKFPLGIKYRWTNGDGKICHFYAHGPNPDAPTSSHAGTGATYRIEIDRMFQDEKGQLHHKNVHKPSSEFYDPVAANATHRPWPSDVPYPWEEPV